ncbi:MAG TPA: enoyl-CoA hydratase-related protein, partial [Variovorax sp.]|nr:enoyl-CoA hydratase-related protein [Variovorax sp.]
MPEPSVLTSDAGAVRTLSLNRPAALNSFTTEMHGELMAALDLAAGDPAVRCVVLTGAGRAFCAGQDLADPAV